MNDENHFSSTLESLDIPRSPARIVQLLLLSEPESQSFAGIVSATSLSKASVSGGLQYLEALGVIEYVRVRESRTRFVRLFPARLANYTKRRMDHFHDVATQLEGIAFTIKDKKYRQEIVSLARLFARLDKNVNEIIADWEDEYAKERQNS